MRVSVIDKHTSPQNKKQMSDKIPFYSFVTQLTRILHERVVRSGENDHQTLRDDPGWQYAIDSGIDATKNWSCHHS